MRVPYFFNRGQSSIYRVQHTAGCIAVNQSRIFEAVIFHQKFFQLIRFQCVAHITGVKHWCAAVHGYEIREALTVDAVVQHKNTVAGLRQRSAGGFQSQDPFAAENQRFILRVQKPG